MNATFGVSSDDRRVVSKTFINYFSAVIQIKEQTSIMNPVIWLKYDPTIYRCNYVYIDTLQRYYYIRDVQIGYDQTMNVFLEEDVLMSWRAYILNLYCLIERQEFNYSPYIVDPELLTRCDKVQSIHNVGVVGLDNNLRYYLVTTGG